MQQLLSGKQRLEGFEEPWVEKMLGEVGNPQKGNQINKNDLSEETYGFPVYNGGISPSGYHSDYNCEAHTIIISEGGNSCGFANYITQPFWAGGHCYILTPSIEVTKEYLYHALKFYEAEIMDLRTGSGLPNIKKSALKQFCFSIPSNKEEQTAIARVLTDMDSELAALSAKLAKYEDLKQGMMQQLLTGKIRLI